MRFTVATLLTAAALAMPGLALAHPRLVSANPAAEATVTRPTRIALEFSEAPVAPLSGIALTMTSMPGMANHEPMPIKGFTTAVQAKSLVAILPRALPAGTYALKWHAVAADQHRVEGAYSFTVR